MKKVQGISAFAALTVLAAAVACNRPPGAGDGPENGGFGSAYEILTNATPAAPDESPALASDSLLVLVRYAGGCADHDFDLISSVSGDSAEVWLVHDDGGDECEASVSERLQLAVPEHVLAASRIDLLNPNSDVPFIVRWDAPESLR